MDPLVSVIIPTRGRPEKLRACLGCLSEQNASTPRFEVVVSLDGPCEASRAVCELAWSGFDMVLVESPRQGIAVAKNWAIERSRGACCS
ncbi:glycosyltransferase family A protein [Phycisphaerales bacterium ac7]